MPFHRMRQITLALVLALSLPACTPAPTTTKKPAGNPVTTQTSSLMLGKAFLDVPISGATLRILDTSGNLLQEATGSTDVNGFFAATLPASTLKDFRVEITGGMRGTNPSDAVLKADLRNFDPLIDRVYVNAATTLAAAKLDQNPQASFKDIQATVAHFLKLPENTALGVDLDNPSLRDFSHSSFMSIADGQGGLNSFVNTLSTQVGDIVNPQITDAVTSYDFTRHSLNGIAADIAKTVAIEIGKGALGKVGSSLMGCALDSIFGSSTDKTVDEIRQQFDAQRQYTFACYNGLNARMDVLQLGVQDIKNSIAALETSMNKQFGLAAYNSRVGVLLDPISTIDALYRSYVVDLQQLDRSNLTKEDLEKLKPSIDQLTTRIEADVPKALTTIHYALMGVAGGDGAIAQWHRVVGNNNRNGEHNNHYPYLVNATFVDQLNDQFEYFEGEELRGIALLVEAHNYKKNTAGAQSDFDFYTANIEKQRAEVYSPRLTCNVLLTPINGLMWDRDPLAYGALYAVTSSASLPVAITTGLTALQTGGFNDWRVPTMDELYKLASSDANRSVDALGQAGFNLPADVKTSACAGTISSQLLQDRYWYINTAGNLALVWPYPKSFFVLPVRYFKKDSLATL